MSQINDELIGILKSRSTDKGSAANLLMELIPMGKETAYRRLRGEIPFTLDEGIIICKKLNISLDLLIGIKHENNYAFHLSAIFLKNPIEEYMKMMQEIADGVTFVSADPNSISYRANAIIPGEFLNQYKLLSKVYLYIIFYQLHPDITPKKLSELYIPPTVHAIEKEVAELIYNMNSLLILNKNMFKNYIGIVKHFYDMDIISKEQIVEIREQLHSLLNNLEECAATGKSPSGKKMDIYLSQIAFDCSYTYLEGMGAYSSALGVYCVDHISCEDELVCKSHKKWIESLIRFSTLISASGEFQRISFFEEQREIINSIKPKEQTELKSI